MTVSAFRSLSIGDSVPTGFGTETVTNVYTRVIDGEPVAFIETPNLGPIPEDVASCLF
jgi:hypothetical protein